MSSRQYADFDVLIRQVGDVYEGRVVESPVGETAEVRFAIPFSDLDLERFLLRIGHARRRVRSADSQRLAEIRDFGGTLFDAIFREQIGTCLRRSLDRAEGEGKGLRIRLRLPSNRLADVPWEFLYDKTTGRFLCLSESTPVVRYIELAESPPRVTVDGPLRMLVVISSPGDYPPLDVEHEWANLETAVSGLVESGRLQIERLRVPTMDELQRRLRREDYHVLHYIGHGGFDSDSGDGVLVLQDDAGMSRLESGRDLSTLLYDERSLQLAVLNSCEGARAEGTDPFSGTAQSLVRQGVMAVLAMQFEITDESAIVFARNFYESLADGLPVDAATNAARKAVFAASRTEWGTPVLYMRAPDGELFRGVRAVPPPVPVLTGLPQARTQEQAAEPTVPAEAAAAPAERAVPVEQPVPANEVPAETSVLPAPVPLAAVALTQAEPGDSQKPRPSGADAVAAAQAAWEESHPGTTKATVVNPRPPETDNANVAPVRPEPQTFAGPPPVRRDPQTFAGVPPVTQERQTFAGQPPVTHGPTGWQRPPGDPSRKQPEDPRKGMPKWLIALLVILTVLVVALVGYILSSADGDSSAADDTSSFVDDSNVDVPVDPGNVDEPVEQTDFVTQVEDACAVREDAAGDAGTIIDDAILSGDLASATSGISAMTSAEGTFVSTLQGISLPSEADQAVSAELEALSNLQVAVQSEGDDVTVGAALLGALGSIQRATNEWAGIGVSC